MFRRSSIALAGAFVLLGITRNLSAATPALCDSIHSPRGRKFEVGMTYQSFIPSGLPDISTTLPAFGPLIGVPLLGGTLQTAVVTGSDGVVGLSLTLAEITYRLEMDTPFFHTFALFGGHWLHYASVATHEGMGVNLGLGISFPMGESFEMAFALRTYIQSRTTLTFGGGFSFLL